MRLRGAVVLVTGASSGIGEATALQLARKGARLALCARRLDRLQSVAERCRKLGSPAVTVRKADVGKRAEARAFVAGAVRDFERVDALVNNAGVGWRGRLWEMPEDDAERLVDINVLGLLWTTQAVLPPMLAARAGVIVNVSSVVGFRPAAYSALYSATKHAVVGLSHALRGELSGTGVKVSVVYPASTRTEWLERLGETASASMPAASADSVARTVVNALRWPRRDVIVFPYRLAQMAEPFLGGPLDHILGEARRRQSPDLEEPVPHEQADV